MFDFYLIVPPFLFTREFFYSKLSRGIDSDVPLLLIVFFMMLFCGGFFFIYRGERCQCQSIEICIHGFAIIVSLDRRHTCESLATSATNSARRL